MSTNQRFAPKTELTITPFWRRLPGFFIYPLKTASILRIAGYALVAALTAVLPKLLGGIVNLVLIVLFLKYVFVIMERTMNGQFESETSLDADEGDVKQVFRQYGLIIILAFQIGICAALGGRNGLFISLLMGGLMMPAAIMIIAVTHSLSQALNPLRILFYIKTIGIPYLALCFFLFSLMGSSAWLQSFLHAHVTSWMVQPLMNFVSFYFMLMMYHMMGYAIYQYHQKLGVDVEVGFEQAEANLAEKKGSDPALALLSTLIADGQEQAAIDLLREAIKARWENNELHERYQKLLMAHDPSAAQHHAREFIAKMVNEKRLFKALDLCEYHLKLDREFRLQDSYQIHVLATAAKLASRPKLALDLMRQFDRRYPTHPDIPAIYFLSAQLLSEHYRKNAEAQQILQAIQRKFPDHPLAGNARDYAVVLDKMAALG
ncbi:tetratricopeptide repeat protein [Solimicrobium silvestre]|uniref:Tetratricopeptide repeat n=1 Tax=Solimicrobium silvestre TaxID=2099400 RepID=A0A2S9GV65_9BURK|nr:hypothetical protein [Solimicrobium silvestre]PRC91601.1 hypothetical protein S2091_3717 [Solimicrobium silvestre]